MGSRPCSERFADQGAATANRWGEGRPSQLASLAVGRHTMSPHRARGTAMARVCRDDVLLRQGRLATGCLLSASLPSPRRVVVLGSTGSIGTSTLDVITHLPERLQTAGLSAHSGWAALFEQANRHRPPRVVVTDPERRPPPRPQQARPRHRVAHRPRRGGPHGGRPRGGRCPQRHRRRRRPGRDLGGAGGRQDGRGGQQGNARHGRAARHGAGRPTQRHRAAGR